MKKKKEKVEKVEDRFKGMSPKKIARVKAREKEAKELREKQDVIRDKVNKEKEKKDLKESAARKEAEAAKIKLVVKPKKTQRLVAERNMDRLKAEGWKVVKEDVRDEHGKVLGARTNMSDLTLMEK